MTREKQLSLVLAAGISLLSAALFANVTYYVSPKGDDSDGLTWATAFRHPQTAVNLASGLAQDVTTVVVTNGTYNPVECGGWTNVIHVTKSHVHVRSFGDRDNTVLRGFKLSSGQGEQNSRGLMIDAGLEDVLVSGFTITYGCTIYNKGFASSVIAKSGVVSNCTVHTYWRGRNPMISLTGTAQMKNCLIDGPERATHSPNSSISPTVRMDESALLENCTIRDVSWSSYNSGDHQAVYITSSKATVRGCVIAGNTYGQVGSTGAKGSGIYASAGLIENCTVYGNKAYGRGGGIYIDGNGVTLRNCILWGNEATVQDGGNDIFIVAGKTPTVEYCDASDLTPSETTHNISADPMLVAPDKPERNFAIDVKSPCAGVGRKADWMTGAKDFAGGNRLVEETVSIGAYEPQSRYRGLTATVSTTSGEPVGRAPLKVDFVGTPGGAPKADCSFAWDFGDGTVSTDADPSHTYGAVGAYTVKLTVSKAGLSDGVAELTNHVVVVGSTAYVSKEGANAKPYDTWAKAARSVEDACRLRPDDVVVSNGTYAVENLAGLVLENPLRVTSVNGPSVTVLDTGGAKSEHALATLKHDGALLKGFSLTRGCQTAVIMSKGALVDCIVTNHAQCYRCVMTSFSGGVASNCVFDATDASMTDINAAAVVVNLSGSAGLVGCTVRGLSFDVSKAAGNARACGVDMADAAYMRNCLVTAIDIPGGNANGNCGVRIGGNGCKVENCTITDVRAAASGGRAIQVTGKNAEIRNTIMQDCFLGTAPRSFALASEATLAAFENNCLLASDLPSCAVDCVTDDAGLVAGSAYRITTKSPCYNAGRRLDWCRRRGMATDIEGQERRRNRPDIGCYEVPCELGLAVLLGEWTGGGEGEGEGGCEGELLPGQDVPEELLKKYVADYESPTNLHYAYVAPYYVAPSVTAGERVNIRYYVTDWDQSEVQHKDFSRRFDVTVRCVSAAGETLVRHARDVPAGDGELAFDGLAAGEWNYALSAVDLTNGLPSHVVWGAFRVVEPGTPAIPDASVYTMTAEDLEAYGIRNDGDFERIVLVPPDDDSVYRAGTQALEAPGKALLDAYLAAHPHQDDPVRPGYAAYVPSVDALPCPGAYRVVRVVRDTGYDTNAVEQAARKTLAGIQRLWDEKAAAGFRKVVMLPGTYRISASGTLNMVSNLVVDLNGATIKENGFTGAHAMMVSFSAVRDAALVNGTLEGDYFEHDYAGSPDKSEWPMGFEFASICSHCALSNVVVKNITGYGGGCGYSNAGPGAWLSYADERTTNRYGMNYTYINESVGWDKGGLRSDGTLDPNAEGLYTSHPVSLYRYENFGWLQLSRKLGRGWLGARGWNFIFAYYDAGGACLGTEIASHYRLTKIPSGAKTVRISVEIADTSELADGLLMLAYMKIPVNCSIVGCTFDRCRAVGFAMGPCRNFLLKDNLFTHSGEVLAKCAFDAEDGADFSQDITFERNVFRDNPNSELLTCKGINFVFERNSCSFSFYSRTYGYCVRNNDVTGASFGCDTRTMTGYCRISDNTYRDGKLLLGGKGQRDKGWNVIIDGETFTKEKNGATFAAASSGTGLFRDCSFDRVGNAVGNATACVFTDTRAEYCGNGWHGTWTSCTATGGASSQQYSDNVFLNCRLNGYSIGCSMGTQVMADCTLTDMKLTPGAHNSFTGTLIRCTLVGATTVPSCWKTLE